MPNRKKVTPLHCIYPSNLNILAFGDNHLLGSVDNSDLDVPRLVRGTSAFGGRGT